MKNKLFPGDIETYHDIEKLEVYFDEEVPEDVDFHIMWADKCAILKQYTFIYGVPNGEKWDSFAYVYSNKSDQKPIILDQRKRQDNEDDYDDYENEYDHDGRDTLHLWKILLRFMEHFSGGDGI